MHTNTFAIITYKPCEHSLSCRRTRRKIYVYTSEQVVMLGTSLSPLLLHIMHIRLICSIKADYGRKQFLGTLLYPQLGNELLYMHVKCIYLRMLPCQADACLSESTQISAGDVITAILQLLD